MTISNLQDALVEELKELFKDRKYKKYSLETEEVEGRSGINVFPQGLPKKFRLEDEADEEFNYAPYIIVRVMSGEGGNYDKADLVEVYLIICIFDDAEDNQGHRDVLEMIEVIKNRFLKNPLLKNQYVYNEEKGIQWVIDERDTYPLYPAGMSIYFDAPTMRKEDDYC